MAAQEDSLAPAKRHLVITKLELAVLPCLSWLALTSAAQLCALVRLVCVSSMDTSPAAVLTHLLGRSAQASVDQVS
jgi:hypothetical protein